MNGRRLNPATLEVTSHIKTDSKLVSHIAIVFTFDQHGEAVFFL